MLALLACYLNYLNKSYKQETLQDFILLNLLSFILLLNSKS